MTYRPWLGPAHSGANYGCLYTGKAVASALAGPVAAALHSATGSWDSVLLGMAAASLAAALVVAGPIRSCLCLRAFCALMELEVCCGGLPERLMYFPPQQAAPARGRGLGVGSGGRSARPAVTRATPVSYATVNLLLSPKK